MRRGAAGGGGRAAGLINAVLYGLVGKGGAGKGGCAQGGVRTLIRGVRACAKGGAGGAAAWCGARWSAGSGTF